MNRCLSLLFIAVACSSQQASPTGSEGGAAGQAADDEGGGSMSEESSTTTATSGGSAGAMSETGTGATRSIPGTEETDNTNSGGAAGAGAGGAAGESGSLSASGAAGAGAGGAAGESGSLSAGGSAGAPVLEDSEIQWVNGPVFVPNPNTAAPLAGTIQAESNVPANSTVLVSGGGETWELQLGTDTTVHAGPVIGLKPDTSYTFTLAVSNADAESVAPPVEWRTPALPEDFPEIVLVESDVSRMEPGMTLFDVRPLNYLVVVDDQGQVRWHYKKEQPTGHILLADGNIAYVVTSTRIAEIDWFGDVVTTWEGNYHHAVHEMPDGHILGLSAETRTIDGYPTSNTDPDTPPRTATVRGDIILESTRTGEIANEIHLLDILDPTRVGQLAVSGDGIEDWSHANAVVYDPKSDAYLVSVRHQDAVVKIERDTQALVWILGTHANWQAPWSDALLTPVGANFEWPFQQHAVELTPEGIILYDNGNVRAAAYETATGPQYSRAVRYAVDEYEMTVSEHWSHLPTSEGEVLFSSAASDADRLPNTDNVLITSGTLGMGSDPVQGWSQILEVDPNGAPVFELNVMGVPNNRLTSFEAERIPDIRQLEFSSAAQN